ncbi:MAG: CidA/LrgA family protein [Zoogloeaceae bacterium]|nr:CidA/LrgA family protein [Rhodocyclaceae bacterium]MCP5234924.1 CidA/LrgA family protein [Zoogloeaceae bacterium]
MLKALTLLLLFQLAGEVASRLLGLPVPGPVVGMALMFLLLLARGGPGSELRDTSNTLLSHLSLLFVPAGTGVLLHIHRVAEEWLALSVALVGSTLIGIAVTAMVLNAMIRRSRRNEAGS